MDADAHSDATRRFATPTDSVAAVRSILVPEMFRAITRTALFVQAKAVRSVNRVELTSDAWAISPCRDPVTCLRPRAYPSSGWVAMRRVESL